MTRTPSWLQSFYEANPNRAGDAPRRRFSLAKVRNAPLPRVPSCVSMSDDKDIALAVSRSLSVIEEEEVDPEVGLSLDSIPVRRARIRRAREDFIAKTRLLSD